MTLKPKVAGYNKGSVAVTDMVNGTQYQIATSSFSDPADFTLVSAADNYWDTTCIINNNAKNTCIMQVFLSFKINNLQFFYNSLTIQ